MERIMAVDLSPEVQMYTLKVLGVCLASYIAVVALIPIVKTRLPPSLCGKDLCKKGTPAGDIPM